MAELELSAPLVELGRPDVKSDVRSRVKPRDGRCIAAFQTWFKYEQNGLTHIRLCARRHS